MCHGFCMPCRAHHRRGPANRIRQEIAGGARMLKLSGGVTKDKIAMFRACYQTRLPLLPYRLHISVMIEQSSQLIPAYSSSPCLICSQWPADLGAITVTTHFVLSVTAERPSGSNLRLLSLAGFLGIPTLSLVLAEDQVSQARLSSD